MHFSAIWRHKNQTNFPHRYTSSHEDTRLKITKETESFWENGSKQNYSDKKLQRYK